ncbi:hypothetical protein [Candidatus Amarolinea dominans]
MIGLENIPDGAQNRVRLTGEGSLEQRHVEPTTDPITISLEP